MNTPNSDPNQKEAEQNAALATKIENGKKAYFSVAASPFNGVKLEIALIIVVAIVLWFVVERLYPHRIEAFLLLGAFSLLAAGWIIMRARRVLKRVAEQQASR